MTGGRTEAVGVRVSDAVTVAVSVVGRAGGSGTSAGVLGISADGVSTVLASAICADARGGTTAVRLAVELRSVSAERRVATSVVFGRDGVGAVALSPKADIMSDQTAPRDGFCDGFCPAGTDAMMVRGKQLQPQTLGE